MRASVQAPSSTPLTNEWSIRQATGDTGAALMPARFPFKSLRAEQRHAVEVEAIAEAGRQADFMAEVGNDLKTPKLRIFFDIRRNA